MWFEFPKRFIVEFFRLWHWVSAPWLLAGNGLILCSLSCILQSDSADLRRNFQNRFLEFSYGKSYLMYRDISFTSRTSLISFYLICIPPPIPFHDPRGGDFLNYVD